MKMWRATVACVLSIALANIFYLPSAVAKPKSSNEERQVEKLKAGIWRLGTGPDARLKVKLKDKTEISGYISESGDESFVVVDAKTGKSNPVAYAQVAQAKGNNLSSKQKLAITLVVVGAIGILILLAAPKT
jgi:hypothetical protein